MKFYVYTLTDPRTGRIFYVGKGQGDRMYQHEKEARGGRVSRKCALIREILADGYSLRYATVSRHRDSQSAFRAEAVLIAEIGRDNLTNVRAGVFDWRGTDCEPKTFFTIRWLRKLAPTFLRLIMALKNGTRLMVVGGLDVTQLYENGLHDFIDALGLDVVIRELTNYKNGIKA